MSAIKLLLIEDNKGDARLLREMLRETSQEFDLVHVERLEDALKCLQPDADTLSADTPLPDVILLDLSLPDGFGLDNVTRLHAIAPDVPIVILTGQNDEATALRAAQVGAQDYLVKGEGDGTVVARSIRYAIERSQDLEALRDSEERFRLLAENVSDLISLHHANGDHIYVSPSSQRLLGYTPEEMLELSPFDLIHPEDRAQVRSELQRVVEGATAPDIVYRIRRKDGDYRWFETLTHPIRDLRGQVVRLQTASRDVTERIDYENQVREQMDEISRARQELETQRAQLLEANARLESLATEDGLTGLKNHRTFQDRLRQEFARAQRHETPLSLLMIDVDKFKLFNDAFGHPAGDVVLKRVAQMLQSSTRGIDFVARYGGEEFVAVLPSTDCSGALAWAERYRLMVQDADWPQRAVTVSVGAATFDPHAPGSSLPDAAALISQADQALYVSKNAGRNRVSYAMQASTPDAMTAELQCAAQTNNS